MSEGCKKNGSFQKHPYIYISRSFVMPSKCLKTSLKFTRVRVGRGNMVMDLSGCQDSSGGQDLTTCINESQILFYTVNNSASILSKTSHKSTKIKQSFQNPTCLLSLIL